MPLTAPLPPGLVLNDRYLIRHMLGQGGFGRTYLAEDSHRFNEPCVLKEFAPQLHQPDLLRKARELFEREAGILYQLQHEQIPEFRALLTVSINQEQSLFLVEQFIRGESYAQRVDRGLLLTEAEAIQFLRDLIPVLGYIHSRGVIHRDISPDNLIGDPRLGGKPVLIDFGSVKQVATTAMKLLGAGPVLTQIHKLGYTPPEQFRGEVHPSSDFYAVAVTTLVLLTGRVPTDFYDEQQQAWRWRSLLTLNSGLGDLLDRMLSPFPQNRYPTAEALQQALNGLAPASNPSVPASPAAVQKSNTPPSLSNIKTVAVAPAAPRPVARSMPQAASPAPMGQLKQQPLQPSLPRREEDVFEEEVRSSGPVQGITRGIGWLLLLPFRLLRGVFKLLWGGVKVVDWVMTLAFRLVLLGGLLLAFVIGGGLLGKFEVPRIPAIEMPKLPNFDGIFSGGEGATDKPRSCSETVARHKEFNIPSNEFYGKVNQRLYDRHPELKGRPLNGDAQDAPLREEWCVLAEKMLEAHSKGKSPF